MISLTPVITYHMLFFFIFTTFLFVKEYSCAFCYRTGVNLSSNTLNFIHKDMKIAPARVSLLRREQYSGLSVVEQNESMMIYFSFREFLFIAAKFNDTVSVKNYLDILYSKFSNVNHVDSPYEDEELGTTMGLIHYAIYHDNLAMLSLIMNGYFANLELTDRYGRTPLAVAVSSNRFECISLLVSQGARIDYKIGEYHSLLHYAASTDQLQIINDIKSAGHDLSDYFDDDQQNVETPLELAVKTQSLDCALILYNNGAPYCLEKIKSILEKAYVMNEWSKIQFIEKVFGV